MKTISEFKETILELEKHGFIDISSDQMHKIMGGCNCGCDGGNCICTDDVLL